MEKEVRLIDADKLKNHYAWWENGTAEMTLAEAKRNFDVIIDVQPTVDVESARHGRWKQSKYYKNIIFCDECGEPFELSNSMEHWNYCPNCGAKMDKDACGHWHKQGDEYRCSECGDTSIVAFKKCPNCGAKMDEVAK